MRKTARRSAKAENSREQPISSKQSAQRQFGKPLREPGPAVFSSLLDNLEIGVASATPEGVIGYANPRFAEIMGKGLFEIVGAHLRRYLSPGSWFSLRDALKQGSIEPVKGEMKVYGSGGGAEERIVYLSFLPIHIDGTTTIGIVATEMTEQIRTKATLQTMKASLQTLSARMLQVQDEERRRLSRELHDSTGQEISLAIMAIERVAREVGGGAPNKALVDCAEQLRKVESDIRTLSYVLHPPLLDEIGLGAALSWYAEGFVKRTGIPVELEIPEAFPRFRIEKETALFRVIQEALTNVYRHSGSKRARVRLAAKAHAVEAFIEDQGHGFTGEGESPHAKPGVGLQSMRGRIEIVGGMLDVHSDRQGTTIFATVPIEKGETARADEAGRADVAGVAGAKTPSAPKRLLIADDHDVARRGIRMLFEGQDDLEICGEAADGPEVLRQAERLKPDLVILDLSMPKLSGWAVANQIRERRMGTKILIYTSHSIPQLEHSARAAGCDGYVVKSDASRDLLRATREILGGGTFYRSEMAKAQSA